MISNAAIKHLGIVYIGRNHAVISQEIYQKTHQPADIEGSEEGFITHESVFLNRTDAAIHALRCKQIEKLSYHRTKLYSEDFIIYNPDGSMKKDESGIVMRNYTPIQTKNSR
jgi:hypothetical protein